MNVEYSSNNSGGSWWLKDSDWLKLSQAGWEVRWFRELPEGSPYREFADEDGRWLGALATSAIRRNTSLKKAIAEWEEILGMDSTDEGCECCGPPHFFSERKDDEI